MVYLIIIVLNLTDSTNPVVVDSKGGQWNDKASPGIGGVEITVVGFAENPCQVRIGYQRKNDIENIDQ